MLPIEEALGTRNPSNRLVIKERFLYLDLDKNSIQPTRLFEPDDDKGVGAVVVSVVFRPVAVDLDTFDFGKGVGWVLEIRLNGQRSPLCFSSALRLELRRPSFCTETVVGRVKGAQARRKRRVLREYKERISIGRRRDPSGGPVRSPTQYEHVCGRPLL